eukprot:769996-Rhodomonas_salina.3
MDGCGRADQLRVEHPVVQEGCEPFLSGARNDQVLKPILVRTKLNPFPPLDLTPAGMCRF